jgi:hypothetical protein
MTFEDWRATRNQATQSLEHDILEDNFGYVPDNVLTVYVYDGAGVLCSLKNGQYFTHIDRSEYTGTLEAVERRLWDDYAKREVG